VIVRRLGTALLALAGFGLARTAVAAAPALVTVGSNSACPSAEDVVQELGPLLPRSRVLVGVAAPSAEVVDDGESVRVRVGDQERSFRDAGRACRERARTAAVFIGLVLDPPSLAEAPPEPAPPPPPSPAARPASFPSGTASPRLSTPLTLQLGPLLQAAPISDAAQTPLAGGFGARAAWGRGWGVALGAAFLLPTRLALPAADARLVWLPFDVALRSAHELGPVVVSAELGPELALLFASGDRVKNPRTSARVEVGARAAGTLTWNMSTHLGAFVTLFGVVRPKPYEFKLNPDVESGTTPPLWLGAALGLSFRTR
jgi:hypothetical protein